MPSGSLMVALNCKGNLPLYLERVMSKAEPQIPMHYFMCLGTVFFQDPTAPEPRATDSAMLNAVIINKSEVLNTGALGAMQQQFHGLLLQRVPAGQEIEVVEVLINNIMPLGLMTSDQFMQQGEFAPVRQELPPELAEALSKVTQS